MEVDEELLGLTLSWAENLKAKLVVGMKVMYEKSRLGVINSAIAMNKFAVLPVTII